MLTFAVLGLARAQSLVLIDAYDSLGALDRIVPGDPPSPIWNESAGITQSQEIHNWWKNTKGGNYGTYGYPTMLKAVSVNEVVGQDEGKNPLTLARYITDEYWSIHSKYGKTNMGIADKFYHPAAWGQYNAEDNALENITSRWRYRYVLDTYFGRFHCSGIFMPPGELVTIEIPDSARNKIGIIYNQQARNWNGYSGNVKRLFATRWETINLDRVINTVIWPYGAYLAFDINPDTFSQPLEIFIEGGVEIPWFRYGVDTDEEWRNTIRSKPGLVACLESGNSQFVMTSDQVRSINAPTAAMRFFRSCAQVMEATCVKSNSYGGCGPRPSGRERVPVYWYFDTYVPAGEACAYVGWIFICAPPYWAGDNFDGLNVQGGCWGHLHELGHHHQGGWGIGYTGEVTNNVLVVICYSYYTHISGWRKEKGDGEMTFDPGAGWQHVTHPYTCAFGTGDLNQWVSLAHGFGSEKMREFIYADWNNMYYAKGTYGNVGAYLLRAAVIFGYDISDHLKYMGYNLGDEGSCKPAALEVLKNLTEERNLKPWWPVANVFQSGYEVNGTTFETCRPYKIAFGRQKVFNFTKYTNWRGKGTENPQGNWKITGLRGDRGTWEEQEYGVYKYTPPTTNASTPDRWWLTYHDSKSDQDVVTYGTIGQNLMGNEWQKLNIARWFGTVVENYNFTYNAAEAEKIPFGGSPEWRAHGTGMEILNISGGWKLFMVKGALVAPETGNYEFYVQHPDNTQVALYLSEQGLAYDADVDSDFLILESNNVTANGKWQGPGEKVPLTEGVSYSYAIVVANNGSGNVKVGYRVNGQPSWTKYIPADHCTQAGVSAWDYQHREWTPEWEEIKGLGEYSKGQTIKPEIVSISAPVEQQSRSTDTLINGQTNDVYVSKFNPSIVQSFPHLYEFTFGTHTYFETVRLRNITSVANRGVVATVKLICDGREIMTVDYNSYDEETSILKASTSCTVLGIEVEKNSETWDSYAGGSGFSEIEIGTAFDSSYIVPIDHSSFKWSNGWETVKAGAYFNGQGKKGKPGASVSIDYGQGCSEVVIVGDKSYSTDSSKLLAGGNTASVYVNDDLIGTFSTDLAQKPVTGSTQYKQALFAAKDIHTNGPFTLKIVVDSGEVTLSAALLKPSEVDAALNPGQKGTDNAAVVAGAVFGVVAVLALAAVITYFVMKKVGAVVVFQMPIKDDDD